MWAIATRKSNGDVWALYNPRVENGIIYRDYAACVVNCGIVQDKIMFEYASPDNGQILTHTASDYTLEYIRPTKPVTKEKSVRDRVHLSKIYEKGVYLCVYDTGWGKEVEVHEGLGIHQFQRLAQSACDKCDPRKDKFDNLRPMKFRI